MIENDELTARCLRSKLQGRFSGLNLSLSTVRRARKDLGWIATTPRYCQLIREKNKEKRLEWYKNMLIERENFLDVIFTDECSVELQQHSRICYRRKGEAKKLKPHPKHHRRL